MSQTALLDKKYSALKSQSEKMLTKLGTDLEIPMGGNKFIKDNIVSQCIHGAASPVHTDA
jgi:hypothetical protein